MIIKYSLIYLILFVEISLIIGINGTNDHDQIETLTRKISIDESSSPLELQSTNECDTNDLKSPSSDLSLNHLFETKKQKQERQIKILENNLNKKIVYEIFKDINIYDISKQKIVSPFLDDQFFDENNLNTCNEVEKYLKNRFKPYNNPRREWDSRYECSRGEVKDIVFDNFDYQLLDEYLYRESTILVGSISFSRLKETYPSLNYISLRHWELTNVDFSGLSSQSSLKVINLGYNKIKYVDFSGISGSSLEIIYLYDNEISNFNLNGLSQTSLKMIDLGYNRISKFNFNDIAGSSLEELQLRKNNISEIDFTGLSQSSLKELYLVDNQITNIDFSSISGSLLEELWLHSNNISNINFNGLSQSSLKKLYLTNNKITNIDFSGISGSSLKELVLSGNPIISVQNYDQVPTGCRITGKNKVKGW